VGPFHFAEALPPINLQRPALFQLSTVTPFRPSEHGSVDLRTLGLFFESVCLRPVT
jgi:hypothetical protein